MEPHEETGEFDIHTPIGDIRTKGYRALDVVIAGCAFILCASGGIQAYLHREETKDQAAVAAKQAKAIEAQVISQRYFACILSVPQDDRWKELQRGGYCDQISRTGTAPP
jgi:formylmethanofuran:tetrahydromethanopterin formyltransferase